MNKAINHSLIEFLPEYCNRTLEQRTAMIFFQWMFQDWKIEFCRGGYFFIDAILTFKDSIGFSNFSLKMYILYPSPTISVVSS